jgi:undecaprenyl-diphosphatase
MLDYLNDIDTEALLAVNGLHDMFQDTFWWMVSAKWSSLLLVLALVWVLMHQNRRHVLLVLAMLVLAFLLADQVSSGLIKHLVERLRPTHEPSLGDAVHIVNGYRGGMYGFVSSHAANSFAAAMFISLLMRHRMVTISLFTWAALQCYSRVYLGVHYPGDILGGLAVGLLAGWLVWLVMRWIQHRWRLPEGHYTPSDATVMGSSVAITVIGLLVTAALYQWI